MAARNRCGIRSGTSPLSIALSVTLGFAANAGATEQPDATNVSAIIGQLAPDQAREALKQIDGYGRRLLALRSYLRMGARLSQRWSWTREEISQYQGSAKQTALVAEVAAITRHFEKANPGFSIYANTRVRSLQEQIEKWNSNDSVDQAGEEILKAWNERFNADMSATETATADDMRQWLTAFRPSRRAKLAAPGLTLHGRANAIDFQIMKDNAIIAGADTSTIDSLWRQQGWAEKLKKSITAAGPSFVGPLQNPDEPWHYRYEPKEVSEQPTGP